MFFKKSILLSLAAFSFVYAKQEEFTGDCKDIFDVFNSENATNSLDSCIVDEKGKVVTLEFDNYSITEKCVQKALSYDTITKLTYSKHGSNPAHNPAYKAFPEEIKELPNLEDFTFSYSGFKDYDKTGIPSGVLKLSKSVKRISLSGYTMSQDNVDEIATLTNLEQLELKYFNRPAEHLNFDSFKSLHHLSILKLYNEALVFLDNMPEAVYSSANTLTELTIRGHTITNISNQFSKLKNLKILDLRGCEFSNILYYLKDLKNLEYLDVSQNKISGEIPEYLNDLTNLRYVNLGENNNIFGQVLTISNLEVCVYDKKYDLCIPSNNIQCLKGDNYNFKECEEIPISVDGQCGQGYGRCRPNNCCSRYGWCGLGDAYCGTGCQEKYGNCNKQ